MSHLIRCLATAGLLIIATGALAPVQPQDWPDRVDTRAALGQVIAKVDPVYPADVVAANPGAVMAADVIVGVDGTVESVTIIAGPDALHAPMVAAFKQWKFHPFVLNGHPRRVVTVLDTTLPDPRRDAARKAATDFFDAWRACERARATRAADMGRLCGSLVSLSEKLEPSRVLERIHALETHGLSLLLLNRPAEALARFERALEMRERQGRATAEADADTATLLELIAQTHMRLENLAAADVSYGRAIDVFERAIEAVPTLRNNYTARMKAALERYADLKRRMGRADEGRAVSLKADSMPAASRPVPLPAPRPHRGTLIMGAGAPALTDDDLDQLHALVAPERARFFVAYPEQTLGQRRLWADIYLQGTAASAGVWRGRVVRAEAVLATDAPRDVRKSWVDRKLAISHAQVPLSSRAAADVRGLDDRNRPFLIMDSTAAAPLTEHDIARIVRVLRRATLGRRTVSADAVQGELYTNVQSWPIEDMVRLSTDDVHVTLRAGRTSPGPGQRIRLKRAAAGWTIVDLQPW